MSFFDEITSSFDSMLGSAFNSVLKSVTSFAIGQSYGVLKYPQNVGEGVFPSCIQFQEYKRTSPMESVPWTTIYMYMPEKVSNPSKISWEGNSSLAASQLKKMNEGQFSSAAGTWAASSIAQIINSKAGMLGTDLDTILGAGGNMIQNPYLTMMFKGVDQREFAFEFKLFPHSRSECDNIHNIVTAFRAGAYPTGNPGDMLLGYPSEFEIQYLFNGQQNTWLNKFKRSVLTGVDVDYTGSGGWTVTRDGFPSEISLTLSFQEMQLLTSSDIQAGY